MAVDSYPVVWTDEAKKNKEAINQYLQENWSSKEIREFFRSLDKRISLIAIFPSLFQKTKERENVRRSVLSEQVSIYYEFDGQKVEILFLFDNRQDPDKLNFET